MPAIEFTFRGRKLVVETGANQIGWSYKLNTQTYPTYGGEVVQVLSTYIDVLEVQGDVVGYAKMEEIYKWFLYYFQAATQGFPGSGPSYSEEYVLMTYPHRGWTLKIQPIALPAMRYGRDIVVPQWQMQAHIIDPDPEITELTLDSANAELVEFGLLKADVGFRREGNPFSDPLGILTKEEAKIFDDAPVRVEGEEELKGIVKRLNEILHQFLDGDFTGVHSFYELDTESGPIKQKGTYDDKDKPDETKPGGKRLGETVRDIFDSFG